MELEVKGRKPVGRSKKTWSKVVKKDMQKLNITEGTVWQRIKNSGSNSYHVQLQDWETRDNKRTRRR